ncbi:MAG: amidohydrolase [Bacteroidia bacterium]
MALLFQNQNQVKKRIGFNLIIIVGLVSLFSCSQKKQVDLIIHNAIVYTVDSTFSTAESFAIKDGKFVAVGSNDDILKAYTAAKIIDANGKTIYPGFIDSHCHFYGYGKGLQKLDLSETTSFEEVIEKLIAFAKTNKSAWIIGRGWDQNRWAIKEFPTNKMLDSLFPNTPVFLGRIDGHAALINSAAATKANLDVNQKIAGGIIEIKNNKFTGILVDNAVEIVENSIPKETAEEIKSSLLAAEKNCFKVGLTTVDDAGLDKEVVELIDELQKNNLLKMRIYAMLTDNKENLNYYLQKGFYKTDRLNVRSFKFYADGALGSRGACLLTPYTDKPNQQGFLLNTPRYFDSMAVIMAKNGFQMNTHCIGDSAFRLIKRIYTAAINNAIPKIADRRWRIEHAQVIAENDFTFPNNIKDESGKMVYAIIPSVQPTHATSDMYWAKDRLGNDRLKYAYAYNDLLKTAGMVALGTDFPVEHIDPLYTFYAAVARKDLKGFPEGGFQPENALSRENTLRGMTIWGAYANFEEKEKGSIEVNKFADFIILENDLMNTDLKNIPSTRVLSTFVNGEKVY